jgi:hypothetical protein
MKYFIHRHLFCGVKLTAIWSGDQCEGVRLAEKYKNLVGIGIESTGGVITRTIIWLKNGKIWCSLHNLSCLFYGVRLIELWHTVRRFGEQNCVDRNSSHHIDCQYNMRTVCDWSCVYCL